MPLQVDILGGKRTVMNYIMTPIQKSLATAFRKNRGRRAYSIQNIQP